MRKEENAKKLILDIGCGKHSRGDIGIDYSKDSDATIVADSHFLPFKNEVFDEVVSVTVLEHSPNPLQFLKEQRRVLKKNGKVICETDNAQYYKWSVLNVGAGGENHQDFHQDHYLIFYPENVKRLMKLAGLCPLECRYLRTKKKADLFAIVLIKFGIWRKTCLYWRFRIVASCV